MEIKEPCSSPPLIPISGFIRSTTGSITEVSWFIHWIARGHNSFLQWKSALKITCLTSALQKFACICMFIMQWEINLFLRLECVNIKKKSRVRYHLPVQTLKRLRLSDSYHFQTSQSRAAQIIPSFCTDKQSLPVQDRLCVWHIIYYEISVWSTSSAQQFYWGNKDNLFKLSVSHESL